MAADSTSTSRNAIIIGGGPSGIALAHTLKCRLGFDDFEVERRREK
jgi:cation diffusion facilitator CzcD-associated flavoprotein CzcO